MRVIGVLLLIAVLVAPASAAELAEILRQHIAERYPWAEVEVKDISLKQQDLPAAAPLRIVIEQGPPGRTVFHLDYPGGRSALVSAQVKAYDWVVMSRRALRKGYRLEKEDVYMTLVEVGRMTKDALQSAEKAVGRQLNRPVVANAALTESMVSETPIVKRGQRVMLIAEASGFIISTQGELRENASVGSSVKAYNVVSKRLVNGLLVDELTVRVGF